MKCEDGANHRNELMDISGYLKQRKRRPAVQDVLIFISISIIRGFFRYHGQRL